MSVEINASSRLLFGELLEVDGVEFWDTIVLPVNRPRQSDYVYTVEQNDHIDMLAERFYQTPVLWWVIAWANDLEIIPTDLKEGMTLLIPSKEFVEGNFLKNLRST